MLRFKTIVDIAEKTFYFKITNRTMVVMVASKTRIKKITANSVSGFISEFNSIVVDPAYNTATYHSGNKPHFSKTANGLTTPQSIPDNQLQGNGRTYLSSGDVRINAASLCSALLNITQSLSKIRRFQSQWYFNTNGTQALVDSMSGIGILTFPDLPAGSKESTWTREGNTSIALAPQMLFAAGKRITASDANQTITNCLNAWATQCRDSNDIVYKFFQCYSECHASCHNARGRR